MLGVLRQRGLLAKRSIVGWVLLGLGLVWKLLNSASTVAWMWGLFHEASVVSTNAHPAMDGGSMLVSVASTGSTVLFLAGVAWLTALAFIPFLRSNIYAKILRGTLISRHPFDALTRQAIDLMKLSLGPTAHDFVVNVFVVNKSIWPITIQRIEAEAQIGEEWIKLKPSDISYYVEEKEENKKLAKSGLRELAITKLPLEGLLPKLHEVPLYRGVHKVGWVAFEIDIEPEKIENKNVNLRLKIVDSLDGRHPIFNVSNIGTDGQIGYSPKALEQ